MKIRYENDVYECIVERHKTGSYSVNFEIDYTTYEGFGATLEEAIEDFYKVMDTYFVKVKHSL